MVRFRKGREIDWLSWEKKNLITESVLYKFGLVCWTAPIFSMAALQVFNFYY